MCVRSFTYNYGSFTQFTLARYGFNLSNEFTLLVAYVAYKQQEPSVDWVAIGAAF